MSRLWIRTTYELANAQDRSGHDQRAADRPKVSGERAKSKTGTFLEIGVTNRIRTGTNAFTGSEAAVTS